MENGNPVVIVGAGITGLTIAFRLQKRGIPYLLVEANEVVGGKMGTLHKGGFELDLGPATCVKNNSLAELIKDAGIGEHVLSPSRSSQKRYIFCEATLHEIVPHPVKILTNKILSWRGKWHVFKDFMGSPISGDESVASFARRHFGEEVLQKLFNPVLRGIYAGDPEQLSVQSVLPFLWRLESEHGSIIKGLWRTRKSLNLKREIISFHFGFRFLAESLAGHLGRSLWLNTRVEEVKRFDGAFEVTVSKCGERERIVCCQIIFTIPAMDASRFLKNFDVNVSEHLNLIRYNAVTQVFCSVTQKDFRQFDGFGFLIPASEKTSLMGAVHNSGIFRDKAPAGKELFTLFCPGDNDATQIQGAVKEFASILNILSAPEIIHVQSWAEAIPQFEIGHRQRVATILSFERENPGVRLAGSYISGVSIGDCVQFGDSLAKNIIWPAQKNTQIG